MKRGQGLAWGGFIKLLVQLLPLLLAIFALAGLFAIVTSKEKAQHVQDFRRILVEVQDLQKSKVFNSVTVPLLAAKPYDIFTFAKGSSSSTQQCGGNACICLYFQETDATDCATFTDEQGIDFVQTIPIIVDTNKKSIRLRTRETKLNDKTIKVFELL